MEGVTHERSAEFGSLDPPALGLGDPQRRQGHRNRTWPTKVRGRVLLHAGLRSDDREFDSCLDLLDDIEPLSIAGTYGRRASAIHGADALRGGIVGSVEIVDCVERSRSPWFCGPYGFVLRNPEPLRFIPCRGRLGFFRPDLES